MKVPFLANIYPQISLYNDQRELMIKAQRTQCDIFHVHNDPNSIVSAVGSVKGNRKLVFDCHDSDYVRHNQKIRDEKMAFNAADGYIFPSEEYKNELMEAFSVYTKDKPAVVTWPLCNEEMFNVKTLPHVGGICYEGNILPPLADIQLKLPYRVYTEFTAELAKRGIPFHIYPGGLHEMMRRYEDLGALLYEPVEFLKLLQCLTRYDFGLCGSQVKHKQWQTAVSNKIFEYFVAGLPLLVFNADNCAKIAREHNMGVVCESYDAIAEAYFNETLKKELKENVAKHRMLYTMEKNPHGICNTEQVFRAVLGESV